MRHLYADFLDRVAQPARYLGGEYQSVVKDTAAARVCLGFPDVSDIGLSPLGTKILYSLLYKEPRIACERAFAPKHNKKTKHHTHNQPHDTHKTQQPLHE